MQVLCDKFINCNSFLPQFLALDTNQVAELISSDTITVPSEEKVYESVLAWVRHDLSHRRCHLPLLMESVRLPLLSREYLFQGCQSVGSNGWK